MPSKQSKRTASRAGERITHDAVRSAFARRRRTSPAAARTDTVHAVPAADQAALAPRPASLRRWSVAELRARAVAQPPADRVSR